LTTTSRERTYDCSVARISSTTLLRTTLRAFSLLSSAQMKRRAEGESRRCVIRCATRLTTKQRHERTSSCLHGSPHGRVSWNGGCRSWALGRSIIGGGLWLLLLLWMVFPRRCRRHIILIRANLQHGALCACGQRTLGFANRALATFLLVTDRRTDRQTVRDILMRKAEHMVYRERTGRFFFLVA